MLFAVEQVGADPPADKPLARKEPRVLLRGTVDKIRGVGDSARDVLRDHHDPAGVQAPPPLLDVVMEQLVIGHVLENDAGEDEIEAHVPERDPVILDELERVTGFQDEPVDNVGSVVAREVALEEWTPSADAAAEVQAGAMLHEVLVEDRLRHRLVLEAKLFIVWLGPALRPHGSFPAKGGVEVSPERLMVLHVTLDLLDGLEATVQVNMEDIATP